MFNTEFTPCESAAIKLYNRDKADGYWVPDDTNLYASYIFKPNDAEISILDKLAMHGREFCGDYLDGGSAAHLNLDSHLSEEQYRKLLHYAAEIGCKYFTFNVPNSECDDCGYITKVPIGKCPKCGSTHISYYDRVIGYLTKISNWSKGRQEEQKTRVYQNLKEKEF
jgi:ribonucleoside-triphosphate reductase